MTTTQKQLDQHIKRLDAAKKLLDEATRAIEKGNHPAAKVFIEDARAALLMDETPPAWERRALDLGNQLIELLELKTNKGGRINTSWGDKTPLGLGLTVRRVVDQNREGGALG